ncbi:hypothetical protein E4U32_005697 [Claviceps aff. humidiphila group G2b]|nr:hypothetical protein E4U32_005697 [Claviceps aff. humidiphila group G2b]
MDDIPSGKFEPWSLVRGQRPSNNEGESSMGIFSRQLLDEEEIPPKPPSPHEYDSDSLIFAGRKFCAGLVRVVGGTLAAHQVPWLELAGWISSMSSADTPAARVRWVRTRRGRSRSRSQDSQEPVGFGMRKEDVRVGVREPRL